MRENHSVVSLKAINHPSEKFAISIANDKRGCINSGFQTQEQ